METKVDVFKALGDGNRLRILNMLSFRSLCVCEIDAVLNISMSTISSHLKILRNAGLVTSKKDGRWIIYSLNNNDQVVAAIVKQSLKFIESEVDSIADLKKLETITPEKCASA
ncbi:MAG: ArsR family transcriptional regulator [Denitrovibrio sp.]|nr:MAG: ArsR family transcriptional regulator [Denitrovibrio sp.]